MRKVEQQSKQKLVPISKGTGRVKHQDTQGYNCRKFFRIKKIKTNLKLDIEKHWILFPNQNQ